MAAYSIKVLHNKGGRKNKKGLYSIYIRVIMNRKAYFFNLGKKVQKIHWQDKENFWVKPSCAQSVHLNILIKKKLDEMINKALQLESFGHHLTIEDFNRIFTRNSVGSFNEFVAEFMKKDIRSLKLKDNTIKKYVTFKKYLNEFNPDIAFQVLNESLIQNFCRWLQKDKALHDSTILKYLDPFRLIVRHACKEGFFEKDPFLYLTTPYSEKRKNQKEYLSVTEIIKIKDVDIPDSKPALHRVRTWFLFSVYSGIRYRDLKQLQWRDLIETELGICLKARRTKNNNEYHVPLYLSNHAMQILKERRASGTPKPEDEIFDETISDQKYNDHLKDLGAIAGIKKTLKNSSARDAFGKYWARKGVPIQHLARMMGHNNEITTRKYYDIDGDDINEHLLNMQNAGLIKNDF